MQYNALNAEQVKGDKTRKGRQKGRESEGDVI